MTDKRNIDEILDGLRMELRQVRNSKQMTQTKVATAIGVTSQQLQKYEAGANRIPLSRLILFCEFFNINLGDFLNKLIYADKHQPTQSQARLLLNLMQIQVDLIIQQEKTIAEQEKTIAELGLVSMGVNRGFSKGLRALFSECVEEYEYLPTFQEFFFNTGEKNIYFQRLIKIIPDAEFFNEDERKTFYYVFTEVRRKFEQRFIETDERKIAETAKIIEAEIRRTLN